MSMVIQWHPAFSVAMKLLYRKEKLKFIEEDTLLTTLQSIDLMIEKKKDYEPPEAIAKAFRKYSIFEYKSQDEVMSIDVFEKTLMYELLFKITMADFTNEIPLHDLSISLVRYGKPVKMISVLEEEGFTIEQKDDGISFKR